MSWNTNKTVVKKNEICSKTKKIPQMFTYRKYLNKTLINELLFISGCLILAEND